MSPHFHQQEPVADVKSRRPESGPDQTLEYAARILFMIAGFVLVGSSLGSVGGWFLAGDPFRAIGALVGSMLAAPVSGVCGLIAALCRWPWWSIFLVCGTQFGGAVLLAMVAGPGVDEVYSMMVGQIGGAVVGMVLAYLLRARFDKGFGPDFCQRCGYNLTGLRDPRYPECGTPFDPARLNAAPGKDFRSS